MAREATNGVCVVGGTRGDEWCVCGQWYERRRMVRVDSGTRGDEWCVWTMVQVETNGACGKWYERRRMVRVENGRRGEEMCKRTNGAKDK